MKDSQHENGPFASHASLYLLHGLIDDQICLPDLRLVDLRTYILENLQASGFDQVAFHHPIDGVTRHTSTADNVKELDPSLLQTPRGKALIGGPLGALRMTAPKPDPPEPLQNNTIRVSDLELPSVLRGFLNQKNLRSAFVFHSLEYFLNGMDPRATPELSQFLRDVAGRDARGAICVFLSQFHDTAQMVASTSDRGHFLYSFRDRFFDQDSRPKDNVIRIGPPERDEVKNLFRRRRLLGLPTVSVRNLDQAANQVVTELKSKSDLTGLELRDVDRRIENGTLRIASEEEPALETLGNMPGLEKITTQFHDVIGFVRSELSKTAKEGSPPSIWCERLSGTSISTIHSKADLNFAFVGRPGTGKTVVARLVARAFKENGILPSGHFIEAQPTDLKSSYQNGSALKTAELLDRALGGVLFIDEVQSFNPDDADHCDAIRVILKYAEDRKGEMAIILATYPDSFSRFLSIDQGLSRRFSQVIEFEDYDGAICAQIFSQMAKRENLDVSRETMQILPRVFDFWRHDRDASEVFSNAGTVVSMFKSIERAKKSQQHSTLIEPSDFPEHLRGYVERSSRHASGEDAIDQTLNKLNELIGLSTAKDYIRRLVARIRVQKLRGSDAPIAPGHMSFEGNPGTGKTTFARLLGEIFRELGVLKSGHLVEVSRENLVAGYSGQTAPKVQEVVDTAMDGVLFIDEAHNLINDERDSFGREAIGQLTPLMENNRDRLCVIFAGYAAQMNHLFSVDPGWDSRVKNRIPFDDYNDAEMAEIFALFCESRDLTLSSDLSASLPDVMLRLRAQEGVGFANGRSARNLLEHMSSELDLRILADPDGVDHNLLLLSDVPKNLQLERI